MKTQETTERECCMLEDLRPYKGNATPEMADKNMKFCVHCGQVWLQFRETGPSGLMETLLVRLKVTEKDSLGFPTPRPANEHGKRIVTADERQQRWLEREAVMKAIIQAAAAPPPMPGPDMQIADIRAVVTKQASQEDT